jgi:hypothetical protein
MLRPRDEAARARDERVIPIGEAIKEEIEATP